jgi:hypothetical protein
VARGATTTESETLEAVVPPPEVHASNPERDLDSAISALERLQVQSSAVKKGPEGEIDRATKPAPAWHEAPRARTLGGEVAQPCPYGGIDCRGCHLPISVSATALSCADGLVHPNEGCIRAAKEALTAEAKACTHRPFYGVAAGIRTGIYLSWPDCEAQVRGVSHAKYKGFNTLAEAREWMRKRVDPQANQTRPSASFDQMAADLASAVPGGTAPGSIQRRGLLEEKIGAARLDMIQRCVDGECGLREGDETLAGSCEKGTKCLNGCQRSLHMLTCAQVGKGYAALGKFTCHHCVGSAVLESGELSEAQVRTNLVTMFMEMTQGAEATAGSYAEYARLEEEYASGAGMVINGGRLAMPHSSGMAFKNFLTWFVTDLTRGLSLKSMLIGASSYLAKLSLQNWPMDKGVKAHIKQLETNHGLEAEPSTTATPLMMAAMTNGNDSIIAKRFAHTPGPRRMLTWRWVVHTLLEGLGGCRVGEATSGGDFHGLLANNACIITNPQATEEWARETVEVKLEHSKTGHARYIDIAGTTVELKLKMAQALREYWAAAGIETSTFKEGALTVERPDFWAVKVTMLGMDDGEFTSFIEWLDDPARSAGVKKHAKATIAYAKTRYKAKGKGSQAKKHVNIAGGRASDRDLRLALAEVKTFLVRLKEGRLDASQAADMAAVAPGPLLLSSQHGLMGLQPSSTYVTMKELLTSACEQVGRDDPYLNAQQRAVAKWTNHSLRRAADTIARRTKLNVEHGRAEVTTQEIDIFFGWHEMELSKDMQIHYSTLSLFERVAQARITCMA